MHRPIAINIEDQAIPVMVYDLGLPQPARMLLRQQFECGKEAAQYLGVPPYRVYKNIRSGMRIWSHIHNRWFAVRYKTVQHVNT